MNKMSQPLRLELPHHTELITSKTINGCLWFVNNNRLHQRIYAFLAKYQEKYEVKIFNFEIVGNHYHLEACFPNGNRAAFERDFNARIAEAVRFLVKEFEGGPLFRRRYTSQVLADKEAIENYFFYIAHQCVSSKLASNLKYYPQKTLIHDAIKQVDRTYKYFMYGDYNKAKRKDPEVSKDDYWSEHTLRFSRLPGHEDTPSSEYQELMYRRLEKHLRELLEKMEGTAFLGAKRLRAVKPGTPPKSSKKGGRRPLVLSMCIHAGTAYLEIYYSFVQQYQKASKRFRGGELDVEFPEGMYRPAGNTVLQT